MLLFEHGIMKTKTREKILNRSTAKAACRILINKSAITEISRLHTLLIMIVLLSKV